VDSGKHSGWTTLVHLAVHAVLGMVIFAIVAVPALALGRFVKWLEAAGATPYVIQVLTPLEHTIFTADALLYLFLMLKALYKAGKELEL
jgi:hypothetical protein